MVLPNPPGTLSLALFQFKPPAVGFEKNEQRGTDARTNLSSSLKHRTR